MALNCGKAQSAWLYDANSPRNAPHVLWLFENSRERSELLIALYEWPLSTGPAGLTTGLNYRSNTGGSLQATPAVGFRHECVTVYA
jgi:hypothetical protein